MRAAIADGTCQRVPGTSVDAAIGGLLLESVTPVALEVALSVQADLEARADEADALRATHVERARHRAELARRRYLGVDPDNRLVADTLDRLLNDHTDAQVADILNQDGRRSGTSQAFTPSIVLHLRRCNGLASHLERLRAAGLLTIPELAERLGVSTSTIKARHRAGLLQSDQANDKNIRLFDPPAPDDPRLVKRMGSSLAKRASTQPSTRSAV